MLILLQVKKRYSTSKRWKLFIICSLLHCTNIPSSGSTRMVLFCKPFFYMFSKLSKQMLALTKTAVIRLWKVFSCGKWCALFASENGKGEEKKYEENKTRKDASVTLAGSLHTTLFTYILSTLRDHHRRFFFAVVRSLLSLFLSTSTTNFLLWLLLLARKLENSYNVYVWLRFFFICVCAQQCFHSPFFL